MIDRSIIPLLIQLIDQSVLVVIRRRRPPATDDARVDDGAAATSRPSPSAAVPADPDVSTTSAADAVTGGAEDVAEEGGGGVGRVGRQVARAGGKDDREHVLGRKGREARTRTPPEEVSRRVPFFPNGKKGEGGNLCFSFFLKFFFFGIM